MPWPSQCEVCRQWADAFVCIGCVQRFAAPLARCARCGLRLAAAAPQCGQCLADAPPFQHTVCAFDYAFPWDRMIRDLKFRARPELAAPLAQHLCAAVTARRGAVPDTLAPIPLSPQRLSERGYNQAWELTRALARRLRIPACPDLLVRPMDTPHQVQLDRAQRQRNLRGAYVLNEKRRTALQGHHVALVDDVMTTGATVREAAATLLQSGARQVDVWVLARTPQD
jgi:ComF family protein